MLQLCQLQTCWAFTVSSQDKLAKKVLYNWSIKNDVKCFAFWHHIKTQKNDGLFQSYEVTPPAGGVRILPPSPVTVRRAEDFNVKSMTSHSHVTQASQQSRVERHANEQFGRFVAESKQEENVSEAEESEIQVSN